MMKNWGRVTWLLLQGAAFILNEVFAFLGFGQNFTNIHLILAIIVVTAILSTVLIVAFDFYDAWVDVKKKTNNNKF